MFGLLSEHHDITNLLVKLIQHETELESITNERLLLAFECALECDVPPQETQKFLAEHVWKSLSEGALKHSEHLRETMASSVDQMIGSAGIEMFENMFLKGMRSEDSTTAAAFIDFIGYLKEPLRLSSSIVACFEQAFSRRKDTVIRTACTGALMRRAEFRTEKATAELSSCFDGNLVEKHAAIKVMETNPSLVHKFHDELTALLDDANQLIASSAAQCILATGLSQENFQKKEIAIRKAVARWQISQRPIPAGTDVHFDKWRVFERLLGIERSIRCGIRSSITATE